MNDRDLKEELCDICHTNKTLVYISGMGSFCEECFNKLNLNNLGIEDDFKYPKIKTIKGHRFKLSHLIIGDNVFFSAEGIDSDYYFKMAYPVRENGKYAVAKFLKKIEDGIEFKTIDEDSYLKNKGNILISDNYLVIDGKKYTADEFLEIISPYNGFNLTFQINDLSDELLKEDELLIPVRISEKSLLQKLKSTININSKGNYIHYYDVIKVDLAIFEIIDKLDYLFEHGNRDEAIETGIKMLECLANTQTDDDSFPIYHLESICKIIDKYNERNLLSKYTDMFLSRQ